MQGPQKISLFAIKVNSWSFGSWLRTSASMYVGHTISDSIFVIHILLQFEKKTIIAPYKKTERSYEVWVRPLWEWGLDLLNHPRLISKFVWDAEHVFKYDGSHWVRCFHEPWTANNWWKIQVFQSVVYLPSTADLSPSLASHLRQNRSALFYTPIKHSCHHLVPRKAILLWHGVRICLLKFEMVMA